MFDGSTSTDHHEIVSRHLLGGSCYNVFHDTAPTGFNRNVYPGCDHMNVTEEHGAEY